MNMCALSRSAIRSSVSTTAVALVRISLPSVPPRRSARALITEEGALPPVNGRQRALAASRPRAPAGSLPVVPGGGHELAEEPVRLLRGPGREEQRLRRADDAVAELQGPQAVDRDRPSVAAAEGAEEAAVERVEGVDAP